MCKKTIGHPNYDPKDKAVLQHFYVYQGKKFHPCVGWMYQIRYGQYIFDIRDFRAHLGLEEEQKIDVSCGQATFTLKIGELVAKMGKKSMVQVWSEIVAKMVANVPEGDALPF